MGRCSCHGSEGGFHKGKSDLLLLTHVMQAKGLASLLFVLIYFNYNYVLILCNAHESTSVVNIRLGAHSNM